MSLEIEVKKCQPSLEKLHKIKARQVALLEFGFDKNIFLMRRAMFWLNSMVSNLRNDQLSKRKVMYVYIP